MYSSSAYAPFGEQYATSGTADASFTGQDQDTVSSLYDFPARRQSSSQGRWISPDPAGRRAVTLANPQSWNRYAYANNNPLALTDPTGLDDCPLADQDANGNCIGDDNNGGGNDDNSGGGGDNSGGTNDCLFISAGINTTPTNSGGQALEDFANSYNGNVDLEMPYGSGIAGGFGSVMSQASSGPNSATYNFAYALSSVTATNSSVTLVLFSGSAQAFNTALSSGLITQSALDSISQIIYVSPSSPGGFGNPSYSNGLPIPITSYRVMDLSRRWFRVGTRQMSQTQLQLTGATTILGVSLMESTPVLLWVSCPRNRTAVVTTVTSGVTKAQGIQGHQTNRLREGASDNW